jgi:hypothetical protein
MSVQVPSDTARLETFADGVFAIAVTLLILEIRLPASEAQREISLFRILASLWPSYLGYTVSFIITGIVWMNHHNFLKLIDHTDHNFIVLNLLLLLWVAFVPFPTRVLAEHLTSANDKVDGDGILLRVGHSHRGDVQHNPGPLVYLVATVFAFVSVPLSLALIIGLAVLYLLPYRPPPTEA